MKRRPVVQAFGVVRDDNGKLTALSFTRSYPSKLKCGKVVRLVPESTHQPSGEEIRAELKRRIGWARKLMGASYVSALTDLLGWIESEAAQ